MTGFPHQIPAAVTLAPMDGLTDAPARALLTSYGGISYCTTEFVRVSGTPLPERVLLKECPELLSGGRTPSGTPVSVQILGGDPKLMAETARRLAALGALAIDINFGCPARCVNRHDGGSALLRYPDRLYAIVAAVRDAVPDAAPVSAKIRLGFASPDDVFTNAPQIERAGATWLTLHARTREQQYKPFADWERIRRVRECVKLPLVANGDVFVPADIGRCRAATGTQHVMAGRGVIADPFFFAATRPYSGNRFLIELARACLSRPGGPSPVQITARLKHWAKAILPEAGFGIFKRFSELDPALHYLEATDPDPLRACA
ncbi:MAG: tRNA-dihydrouridine synthase family protein [Deltaproteobacteria bacterium]|nr:tRNA-dihydrouridine synthase family protein [Deltaproteobacteria bacterium]